jgi:hypothetical protein
VKHVGELISRRYEEEIYCVWLTCPLYLLLDIILRRTREAGASRAARQLRVGCSTSAPTPTRQSEVKPALVMKGSYPLVVNSSTKYNLMHSKTLHQLLLVSINPFYFVFVLLKYLALFKTLLNFVCYICVVSFVPNFLLL